MIHSEVTINNWGVIKEKATSVLKVRGKLEEHAHMMKISLTCNSNKEKELRNWDGVQYGHTSQNLFCS